MLSQVFGQKCSRKVSAKLVVGVIAGVWIVLLGLGLGVLFSYSYTPGVAAEEQRAWPKATTLALRKNSRTLILAAHPKCPCTRASLNELETIMAQSDNLLVAYVLLYRPVQSTAEWSNTGLKRQASGIAHVQVIDDVGGRQASLFGARTSGQVLLYNQRGLLQFAGGITAARGHIGDNPGRTAVLALLTSNAHNASSRTAVFGCSLQSKTKQRFGEIQ